MGRQHPELMPEFVASAAIGSFSGSLVLPAFFVHGQSIKVQQLWMLPVFGAGFGMAVFPFVAVGLLTVGLPGAVILRRHFRSAWIGVFAACLGAAAGVLLLWPFCSALSVVLGAPMRPPLGIGLCYGVLTALAWWLLVRRKLSQADRRKPNPFSPSLEGRLPE